MLSTFAASEIFEKLKFAANLCEYVQDWSQQHVFHHRSVKIALEYMEAYLRYSDFA